MESGEWIQELTLENNILFSRQEILMSIVSSKCLESFLLRDSCISHLLTDLENPNIHPGQVFSPTIYQREIFERRARMSIEHADEYPNALSNGKVLQDVLTFIKREPDIRLVTVTFNCPTESLEVWCGISKNELHVIGIMQGGHIPDELLRGAS